MVTCVCVNGGNCFEVIRGMSVLPGNGLKTFSQLKCFGAQHGTMSLATKLRFEIAWSNVSRSRDERE